MELYKLVRTGWEQMVLEKEIRRQTNNNSDILDSNEIISIFNTQNSECSDDSKSFLGDEFWPQYLFSSDNSSENK